MTSGYLYLQHRKKEIRREVKRMMIAGMDAEELTLVRIAKKDTGQLRWEHSAEFEWQGRMYDVVHTEETVDSLFFRCWEDAEETAINRRLASLLSDAWEQDNEQEQRKDRIQTFYSNLYKYDLFGWKPRQAIDLTPVYGDRDFVCVELNFPPPVPPPDFC